MGQTQSNESYDCSEEGDGARDTGTRKKGPSSSGGASQEQQQHRNSSRDGTKKGTTSLADEMHVRKLSSVSNRNIQLLSMKPRGEKDLYAEDLRTRRRSSLINLILGAPSGGPKFSDDIRSLSSHVSNFGIEFFPSGLPRAGDGSRASSIQHQTAAEGGLNQRQPAAERRRRSSLGSQLVDIEHSINSGGQVEQRSNNNNNNSHNHNHTRGMLANTLASIDLVSSFELHDKSGNLYSVPEEPPSTHQQRKGRINVSGRVLRRCGSELSLYSDGSMPTSGSSVASNRTSIVSVSQQANNKTPAAAAARKLSMASLASLNETKLIIILQVCLPFILAGFGNMAAGLALHRVAQWPVFQRMPIFFILLPPFVGLKGNIEMTLASRLSTLSNLNLLRSRHQWVRAYLSNTVLTLSQGIALSCFAALLSALCSQLFLSPHQHPTTTSAVPPQGLKLLELILLVVVASSVIVSVVTVLMSGLIVMLSIRIANLIQVNPDNFSTLFAALYGDVSCVLIYALVADWMMHLNDQNLIIWPIIVLSSALIFWPVLVFAACQLDEIRNIVISSIPPMIVSILVSMASGAILSIFVAKFKLMALYQPVVNGFGANLIAVQASRVSTWLWCSALKKVTGFGDGDILEEQEEEAALEGEKVTGRLTTFAQPIRMLGSSLKPDEERKSEQKQRESKLKWLAKFIRTLFWSFNNCSPNSVAVRLLLLMQIPAHTIYFIVIWLIIGASQITISWPFYLVYMGLCLVQMTLLLGLCEPLMTLLMEHHLDPDIFGISLLMALADLAGTLCLIGGFHLLAFMGDPNALK